MRRGASGKRALPLSYSLGPVLPLLYSVLELCQIESPEVVCTITIRWFVNYLSKLSSISASILAMGLATNLRQIWSPR